MRNLEIQLSGGSSYFDRSYEGIGKKIKNWVKNEIL